MFATCLPMTMPSFFPIQTLKYLLIQQFCSFIWVSSVETDSLKIVMEEENNISDTDNVESESEQEERAEESDGGWTMEEAAAEETQNAGFVCTTCGIKFARKFNRDRHMRLSHNNITQVFDCTFCGAFFNTVEKLQQHREQHKPSTGFVVKDSAFRKKCVVYRKTYDEKMLTLENAFNADKDDMLQLITFEVGERKSMKMGVIYHVEFARIQPQLGGAAGDNEDVVNLSGERETNEMGERETGEGGEQVTEGENGPHVDEAGEENENEGEEENENESERENENEEEDISAAINVAEDLYEVCLRAPSTLVTTSTNIAHVLQTARHYIQNRVDDFIENGSGWRLNAVICADIEIGTCAALNGSCNLVAIDFLKALKSTRVSKDMQQCFFHACAYHFVETENRLILDEFIKKHFVVRISNPVQVKDIARFERDNSHINWKINVMYLEGEQLFPLIFSKKIDVQHHITLLLYKTEVHGKVVSHYSYVTNVNKLLRKVYKQGGSISYEKSLNCLNCFSKFCEQGNGPENLKKHYELCSKNKPQAVKVPVEGDVIEFRNHINKFPSYFVGFFDFESCHKKQQYECAKCEKVDEQDDIECPHKTLTKAVQEPITYSYLIMDKHGKIMFNNTYTGKDCVQKFLEELVAIESDLAAVLNGNELLNMSSLDEQIFQNATNCHICDTELGIDKVRDHCHVSGDFLGAAHNICNLQRVEKKSIPMFCHNLTGYDGHFLMQHLGKIKGIRTLDALPYNTEKFRTIEINMFHLKDSLSFLNASLSELMNNLLLNKSHTFPIIDQLGLYEPNECKKKKMILQKGIYPYEYVTSIEKLRRTKRIPKQKHFFSTLTNSSVSDADYAHSKKVFKAFQCQDLVDYTELYCTMDVGILAEVVSQFRKLVLDNFKLDCCHYISTPQMSFDCMLWLTKVEIELLTDIDQILFIEQNIRGGVSYINQRHCKEETVGEQQTEIKFIDGE